MRCPAAARAAVVGDKLLQFADQVLVTAQLQLQPHAGLHRFQAALVQLCRRTGQAFTGYTGQAPAPPQAYRRAERVHRRRLQTITGQGMRLCYEATEVADIGRVLRRPQHVPTSARLDGGVDSPSDSALRSRETQICTWVRAVFGGS